MLYGPIRMCWSARLTPLGAFRAAQQGAAVDAEKRGLAFLAFRPRR